MMDNEMQKVKNPLVKWSDRWRMEKEPDKLSMKITAICGYGKKASIYQEIYQATSGFPTSECMD
jgi:hypothetical protein